MPTSGLTMLRKSGKTLKPRFFSDLNPLLHWKLRLPGGLLPMDNPGLHNEEDGHDVHEEDPNEGETE